MPAPGLTVALKKNGIRSVQEQGIRLNTHLNNRVEIAGKMLEIFTRARVNTYRNPLAYMIRGTNQLRERRDQLGGKVVDTVKAQILERTHHR